MKVYKVELFVLDFDNVGKKGIKSELENSIDYFSTTIINIQSKDIGEWSDDNPLNFKDKQVKEYNRLFGKDISNEKL